MTSFSNSNYSRVYIKTVAMSRSNGKLFAANLHRKSTLRTKHFVPSHRNVRIFNIRRGRNSGRVMGHAPTMTVFSKTAKRVV